MPEREKPKNPGQALALMGFLIIIVGSFVYISSISWRETGLVHVPTVPEWADFMCYSSLSVGAGLMIWSLVLEHRYSRTIELSSKNEIDSTEEHLEKKKSKLWQYILVIFGIDLAIMIFSL